MYHTNITIIYTSFKIPLHIFYSLTHTHRVQIWKNWNYTPIGKNYNWGTSLGSLAANLKIHNSPALPLDMITSPQNSSNPN